MKTIERAWLLIVSLMCLTAASLPSHCEPKPWTLFGVKVFLITSGIILLEKRRSK